jgi:hypothetical protein
MSRSILTIALTAAVLTASTVTAQPKHYALDSGAGLRLHNVSVLPATLSGKSGIRMTISEEGQQRYLRMTPEEQTGFEQLAVIEGLEFGNGVIEAEIAGTPAPGAGQGARGFVGIAFRLQPDLKTYDSFYLRPTNGRAEDQERRNHAVQYTSHPDWPWYRLRKETPSRYEAYVDLMPDTWTSIRIEVRGDLARLYVHGQKEPTLIVKDVKSGPQAKGAIALWLGPGTIAHFRNLRVNGEPPK